MMPTQLSQWVHPSGDGLGLDGERDEPCPCADPATLADRGQETAARALLRDRRRARLVGSKPTAGSGRDLLGSTFPHVEHPSEPAVALDEAGVR